MLRRAYEIIELEDEVTEPVTLPEQKSYSQVDAEYAVKDSEIGAFITSARQLLEAYTNVGFVRRSVRVEWTGVPINLPLGPTGDITSVKDKDDVTLAADKYTVSKYTFKSIGVNEVCESGLRYFYSRTGVVEITRESSSIEAQSFYVCEYETGYETLPTSLKTAVMAQADFMMKQLGLPATDPNQVSPVAMILIKPHVRNLPLNG